MKHSTACILQRSQRCFRVQPRFPPARQSLTVKRSQPPILINTDCTTGRRAAQRKITAAISGAASLLEPESSNLGGVELNVKAVFNAPLASLTAGEGKWSGRCKTHEHLRTDTFPGTSPKVNLQLGIERPHIRLTHTPPPHPGKGEKKVR